MKRRAVSLRQLSFVLHIAMHLFRKRLIKLPKLLLLLMMENRNCPFIRYQFQWPWMNLNDP